MNLARALEGSTAPPEILDSLEILSIPHWNFEGEVTIGQIVVARDLAAEVADIFREILDARFPIYQMVPIVEFDWSDDASMAANNCSAFNYRLKVGKSSLSIHSYGRAIDINPVQNPYVKGDLVLPDGAFYALEAPGTLKSDGTVVHAFESRGWEWGGRWTTLQDFHHFEKPTK